MERAAPAAAPYISSALWAGEKVWAAPVLSPSCCAVHLLSALSSGQGWCGRQGYWWLMSRLGAAGNVVSDTAQSSHNLSLSAPLVHAVLLHLPLLQRDTCRWLNLQAPAIISWAGDLRMNPFRNCGDSLCPSTLLGRFAQWHQFHIQ